MDDYTTCDAAELAACVRRGEGQSIELVDKAIAGLSGKNLKGRPLTVNEARPRTDRPRTGGGGRGGFGGGRDIVF